MSSQMERMGREVVGYQGDLRCVCFAYFGFWQTHADNKKYEGSPR